MHRLTLKTTGPPPNDNNTVEVELNQANVIRSSEINATDEWGIEMQEQKQSSKLNALQIKPTR
jgi:hypothetical protein